MHVNMTSKVDEIMSDRKQSRDEKVKALVDLYEYARAEQRTASESMMVDDDGLNQDLRKIELALSELRADDPPSPEDKGAATL